jgi:hypothetical protein
MASATIAAAALIGTTSATAAVTTQASAPTFAGSVHAGARHKTYYANFGNPSWARIRATKISLLADGNVQMRKTVWRYWHSNRAAGHGRVYVHQSQFGGRNYSFRGQVRLTRPTRKCGRWWFAAVSWRKVGTKRWDSSGTLPQYC